MASKYTEVTCSECIIKFLIKLWMYAYITNQIKHMWNNSLLQCREIKHTPKKETCEQKSFIIINS